MGEAGRGGGARKLRWQCGQKGWPSLRESGFGRGGRRYFDRTGAVTWLAASGTSYDPVSARMASWNDRRRICVQKSIALPARSRSGQRQYESLTTRPGCARTRKLPPPVSTSWSPRFSSKGSSEARRAARICSRVHRGASCCRLRSDRSVERLSGQLDEQLLAELAEDAAEDEEDGLADGAGPRSVPA